MLKVIETARGEIGYKEGPNNQTKFSQYIDQNCPNFYNGKKSWPGGGAEWCDIFVDYSFIVSYGEETARKMLYQPQKSAGAGCKFSANYYRDAGAFIKRGEGDPKPGDQIFFGTYGNESHTGLVEKVEDGRVYTIEGNCDNQVKEKNYSLTYTRISGYGRPDFSLVEDKQDSQTTPAPQPAPAPETPVDTAADIDRLAREVIAGKWGNGAERKQRLTAAGHDFEAVQKRVNELLSANKPTATQPAPAQKPTAIQAPKKYRVTSKTGLNVRAGRSTKYMKLPPALRYGETVEVSGIVNGWAQLHGRPGFVAACYLQKI